MAPAPDSSDLDSLRREPWAAHARHWNRLGPPLRPSPEDLERLHDAWLQSLPGAVPERRIEILSLGVTPEIAAFPWADDFRLTAIDASDMMIQAVWPGDGPRRKAVHGDWLAMPFAAASFDLAVSDCGLAPLSAPGQLAALGRELRRVLRPAGRVVMRHLARPARPETVAAVVRAAGAGQLAGFHELKLRLLMALTGEHPGSGVRLGDAWDCFASRFPDRGTLAARLGCPPEVIATIDAYRDRDARYIFPSLAELVQVFPGFILAAGPAGHYPFAECCPVFALTPAP
jgi:SAM-dependent methyltransferase